MLKAIKLTNLLSFGAETEISLNKGLNVLIGSNGSGKSNLIEAISLLQAMPKDLTKAIRDGGGIEEWLWKGEINPEATIETIISISSEQSLEHVFKFVALKHRPEVIHELIQDAENFHEDGDKYFYYKHDGKYVALIEGVDRKLQLENIDTQQSILAQRKDPDAYPEMSSLGSFYQKIHLYREWQFGRDALVRQSQRADLPNDFLDENISNLALIINSLCQNRDAKRRLLEALKLFYEPIEDFDLRVQGGYLEVFFQESNFNSSVPATRLSDGTLRYLSLLAILLHPNPPPLICIEEPELGLHPDVLPTLIELLKEAAQRTQIIITTHSTDLVDDLTDMPESVLVFDKYKGSTTVNRLNKDDLGNWLKEYKLGQLWRRGDLGGNRW